MEYLISWLHALSKYGSVTRSVVKQVLRSITGKCELERLCDRGRTGYTDCKEIEFCLYHSKHAEIKKILVAENVKVKSCLETILRTKRIFPDKNGNFVHVMAVFLKKIISYNNLLATVDGIRGTPYDEQDGEHEEMLYRLWRLIKGDDAIDSRHSSRWTEIGFQGKNPATDFRGMGILTLKNLIHLFEAAPDVGFKLYGQSQHPQYGFPFAVTGISMTSMTFDLLRSGKLKGYLYNTSENEYSLADYQDYFVQLFGEFGDYWIERRPPNIMSFNDIKEDFLIRVCARLERGDTIAVA